MRSGKRRLEITLRTGIVCLIENWSEYLRTQPAGLPRRVDADERQVPMWLGRVMGAEPLEPGQEPCQSATVISFNGDNARRARQGDGAV